jgi:hypothetical protein
MSRGQHIAADGPLNRSASGGLARGVALIVAAVIVGVLLLRSTDGSEPFRAAGTDPTGAETPDPTSKPAVNGTTTTTAAVAAAKAHDPAQVTVLVANASTVKGAAAKIATGLNASNYVTLPSVNTLSTVAVTASVVYFAAGYEPDAKAIAALLKPAPGVAAMPNPLPVSSLGTAQVLLVVAADLANS